MTTTELALGRLFDISLGSITTDAVAAAKTGLRFHMKGCAGVTIVAVKATDAGTTDDFAADLNQHTASTGGTSTDLDIVTDYFSKTETTLDGDETWVRTTQTAASEITAVAGTAELQGIFVIEVAASQLADGYEWISLNMPDLGSTDVQWYTILYIPWGLKAERKPENLPDWLA